MSFSNYLVISCGLPFNSSGLIPTYSNVTYGSTVTYSCIDGYNLVGNPNHICTISGKWSDTPPQCQGQHWKLYYYKIKLVDRLIHRHLHYIYDTRWDITKMIDISLDMCSYWFVYQLVQELCTLTVISNWKQCIL